MISCVVIETISQLWLSWETVWSGETIYVKCLHELTELAGLLIGQLNNAVLFQVQTSITSELKFKSVSHKCCR